MREQDPGEVEGMEGGVQGMQKGAVRGTSIRTVSGLISIFLRPIVSYSGSVGVAVGSWRGLEESQYETCTLFQMGVLGTKGRVLGKRDKSG